jgi:excisionase family DNA binding protein
MSALTMQRTPTSHRLFVMSQRKRPRHSHTPSSAAQLPASPVSHIPPRAESAPRLLTLQEVGKILRVGRTTVWEMVNCGELTAVRIRGKLLNPCEEPERYLAELIEDGRASAVARRAVRLKTSTLAGSRR